MNYPAYESYKDSGVKWLGEVPSEWDALKLKYAAPQSDVRVPYYGLSFAYMGLEHIESWTGNKIEDSEATSEGIVSVFEKNQVLFGKLRPYLAKVYLAREGGCASTEILVLSPKENTNPNFLKYYLLSRPFIEEVNATTFGSKMPRANWESIGSLKFVFPNVEEQQSIAAFLDEKTTAIDDLIAKKEKLLELLAEKRTALITQAVTKGLDPTAPTKPSGIDWLGEIPEDWKISKLKFLTKVNGRIGFRGYTSEDLVPEGEGALTLGGANTSDNGNLILKKRTYLSWEKYYESPEIIINQGDIVIGQRGSCGQVAFINKEIGPATINPSLVLLNNLKIDGKYLKYSLVGKFSQTCFELFLNNTAVPMITQEQFNSMLVFLPPKNEIIELLQYLDSETAKIDKSIISTKRTIEKLKEYRNALITNAVTGKIKVA